MEIRTQDNALDADALEAAIQATPMVELSTKVYG
jgi:hypothetical protein